MKIFKSEKSANAKTKSVWLTILLIGMLTVGITSCNDDDDMNDVNPDGNEKENGWFVHFEMDSPSDRIHYMGVYNEIPEKMNPSNAVEIGIGASSMTYGDNVYTVNSSANTITKWEVDRVSLEFSPVGILSIASAGFSNFNEPVILSENQAFMIDLEEGSIVEWNPTTMEIIESYNVTPNPLIDYEEGSWTQTNTFYPSNGKIFMPVRFGVTDFCCDFSYPGGMMVGVLDPAAKTMEYVTDSRSFAAHVGFVENERGEMFQTPSIYNQITNDYFNHNDPGFFTILKFNADGTYDPNFELKLDEILPIKMLRDISFISGDKIVLAYMDTTKATLSWDDRWDFRHGETIKVVIDMNTLEVTPFAGFEGYDSGGAFRVINGENYHGAIKFVNDQWHSTVFLENSFGNYTEVSNIDGGLYNNLDKLW
ncbi:MAG: hypothetical protein AAF632_24440 [Bacteroidota bacterium]